MKQFLMRVAIATLFFAPTLASALPAFPGAEGFGAATPGGRGGTVIKVTNLNDSGAGSLRAALTTATPRTIVFTVGGTITLNSVIAVTGDSMSYVTVAGQTAPGGGIQIKGYGISFYSGVHDIIVRYLKVRPGDTLLSGQGTVDSIGIQFAGLGGDTSGQNLPVHDAIVDHCDMEYSPRDNASMWDNVHNITLQRSIMANSILHDASYGGKGLLIGMEDANFPTLNPRNISIHHNLIAHNVERHPAHGAVGAIEVVNNVVYNWRIHAVQIYNFDGNGTGTRTTVATQANYIGNYYKPGPDWIYPSRYELLIDVTVPNGLYVHDNLGPHRSSGTQPDWDIVGDGSNSAPIYEGSNAPTVNQKVTPFAMSAYPITTQAASAILANVLSDVGANKVDISTSFRDALTQGVIDDATNGTGQVISGFAPNYTPALTWPTLSPGTPPTDADNDGMSDAWEMSHFGSLNQSSNGDFDGNGWTNLEEYINGTGVVGGCVSPTLDMASLVSDTGFAWLISQVSFGTPADISLTQSVSTLRLFENTTELGPPHSLHDDIRNLGLGRFSHWSSDNNAAQSIRFSATDNTNVTTNERTYRYTTGCTPEHVTPAAPTNLRVVFP